MFFIGQSNLCTVFLFLCNLEYSRVFPLLFESAMTPHPDSVIFAWTYDAYFEYYSTYISAKRGSI
jgi:hypothetical protein